jgi:hypothetical protein
MSNILRVQWWEDIMIASVREVEGGLRIKAW